MNLSPTPSELRGLQPYLTPHERVEMDRLLQTRPLRWTERARPEQLPPAGDWLIWLVKAGRGWGKTLSGAEWAWEQSKTCARIAIVAATFGDGRDMCIEGETGIKTLHPELEFNRSMGEMTFPSGARGKLFSGEEPDRLRGPNNYAAWCDELASWKRQRETWDMLMFTLRKGASKTCITTTPKPGKLLREIEARTTTVTVIGHTRDNLKNLSAAYIENVIKPYEGTRLGRQELDAETLEDVQGALWGIGQIDTQRVTKLPDVLRVVVAVDPAATSTDTSDEAGIITSALGVDKHGYVLGDSTLRGTPTAWAKAAIADYYRYRANYIVAEANNGGEMVKTVIQGVDPEVPVKLVWAADGKRTRAEPVSMRYEKGEVHHVGILAALEDEMTSWVPLEGRSPNRVDALVWGMHELGLATSRKAGF